MSESTAIVSTTNASRYLQQLCKHWAHRFTVDFSAEAGSIDMGDSRIVTLKANSDTLSVTVSAPEDSLQKLEEVVEEHIVRFAFREELSFSWQRN